VARRERGDGVRAPPTPPCHPPTHSQTAELEAAQLDAIEGGALVPGRSGKGYASKELASKGRRGSSQF